MGRASAIHQQARTGPERRDRAMKPSTESKTHPGDALVTGASSGIGAALAEEFARRGHRVILLSRQADRLNAVADRIEAETGRRPFIVPADLSKHGAGRDVAATLSEMQLKPAYVVNCAGFGLLGIAGRLDINEQLAIIDVNCRAMIELTLSLLPGVLEQRGGILNVGSIAGFIPGPGMGVYFATKAFVQSFTQSLRDEYRGRGIKITALCPGPVVTGFQSRAGMVAPKIPWILHQEVEQIAAAGYGGLMRDKVLVAPGIVNLLIVWGGGFVFHRCFIPLVRRFHLRRPNRDIGSAAGAPQERKVIAGGDIRRR
jgi:short-subunit dehydrogenase